jgi:GT2 family glycosyltransferase
MIDKRDVTIIIPHLGGTQASEYALNQCVGSLEATEVSMKKIVVANGERCVTHMSNVWLERQGQCGAVNAAVAITNTPWILITNDDMVYPQGWFEKLTTGTDGLACISPKLIEPTQGAPTFGTYFCGGAGGDFDKKKFTDYAELYVGEGFRSGFNLPFLIKRELWDLVGGYDINYDPWGSNSDSDLEYKIRLAGVLPIQNTSAIVYHFGQTSGTFSPEHQSHWQQNWDYFIKKWGFPRTDKGIWEASFDIPTVNEGRVFTPKWEGKWS